MVETPGIEKVEDLMKKVHEGAYVIPYFQRGFEWRAGMVCDLLESIIQNYYTGILLLWDLNIDEAGHEKWDPVWGAELNNKPQRAILDGQQRLASLYYAIYNPKQTFPNRSSYYLFFLNLNAALNENYAETISYNYYYHYQSWNKIKNKKDDWVETGSIPISILSASDPNIPSQKYIDSTEFDEWIDKYLEKNKDKLPEGTTSHTVYKVINGLSNYSFVFYPLSSERNVRDVCNIFARVNAKGMKLTTFDLMNAFLYPKGIILRKDLWKNLDNQALKDIDSNMNEYLLKLISLLKQNYCSSKYIFNLIPGEKITRKDKRGKKYVAILVQDRDGFKDLWKRSCKYAEKARKMIMNTGNNDFGAIKSNFIPNTTILPVLGAVLGYYENYNGEKTPHSEFISKLVKWYWCAVLSGEYSGSSDTTMSKDYRGITNWIRDCNNDIEIIRKIDKDFIEKELDLFSAKRGSSVYNAVISMLALNRAEDFYTGRALGTGDFNLKNIDDHHIFPSKVKGLDSNKCKEFKETKDFILNRTLLMDETNQKIRINKPSEYLTIMLNDKLNSDEDRLKKLTANHFISDDVLTFLWDDDYDNFIQTRNEAIKESIKLRLGLS